MRRVWIPVALGCLVALSTASARAQEGELPGPKPTKEHQLLRGEVGTWDAVVKWYLTPDGKPSESKATEVNRLLPGGLWLISDFKGEFGGVPFNGHGQTGYDTTKKKYVGTWIDSMGTSLMTMEGDYDASTRTMTFLGDSVDESGKPVKMKIVATSKSDDTHVDTIYMKSEQTGPDFVKMMETAYTKRPKQEPAR